MPAINGGQSRRSSSFRPIPYRLDHGQAVCDKENSLVLFRCSRNLVTSWLSARASKAALLIEDEVLENRRHVPQRCHWPPESSRNLQNVSPRVWSSVSNVPRKLGKGGSSTWSIRDKATFSDRQSNLASPEDGAELLPVVISKSVNNIMAIKLYLTLIRQIEAQQEDCVDSCFLAPFSPTRAIFLTTKSRSADLGQGGCLG